MISEAYERNFRGMASAIDNAHKQQGLIRKAQGDLQRQLNDLIIRMNELERQMQNLQAPQQPNPPGGPPGN